MVQRYDVDSPSVCFKAEDGYFVSYEDYAALELKLLAVLSHLERAASAHKVHTKHAYVNMALRMLKDA